ncbi:hypothetical protein SCA6_012455 [Theobroma cacao]
MLAGHSNPALRDINPAGKLFGDLLAVEDLVWHGLPLARGDDSEKALGIGWAHVNVSGLEVDPEANLRLGLLPHLIGLIDHVMVVVLGVRCSDGAGLAMRRTPVVQKVELLQQQSFLASFG